MRSARDVLDANYLEMRWRLLSLAADLDRIRRAPDAKGALADPRVSKLMEGLKLLQLDAPNLAEQVQLLFTDKSAPPSRR